MNASLPPLARVRWSRTSRFVPSRYPSVGILDQVTSPGDLEAVLELESWTNDRISVELGLLHLVPTEEWVLGQPNASVIMATFCHPCPAGARFSSGDRGAWYAARSLDTALAESIHHRTRELAEVGSYDTRVQMRLYHADFSAMFHDLRGRQAEYRGAYDPDGYTASQALARTLLAGGGNGVLYDSVRHVGGQCLACFRPPLVRNVKVAAHYEYVWDGRPAPRVRRLA